MKLFIGIRLMMDIKTSRLPFAPPDGLAFGNAKRSVKQWPPVHVEHFLSLEQSKYAELDAIPHNFDPLVILLENFAFRYGLRPALSREELFSRVEQVPTQGLLR